MAVVKAPALSLDASGNLGGICYSKWRSLNVARDPWTGTVPNTTAQQIIQGYMTTASQAWSGTLTEAQRQSWREVAKSLVRVSRGMTKYVPSGYQYFVEVQMIRLRLGLGIQTLPYGGMPVSMIGEVQVLWEETMFYVMIKLIECEGASEETIYTEVWRAGPYDNAGRHAIAGEYRYLDHWQYLIDGDDYTTTPLKYYWYKVRFLWSLGATGNWFERQVYTG